MRGWGLMSHSNSELLSQGGPALKLVTTCCEGCRLTHKRVQSARWHPRAHQTPTLAILSSSGQSWQTTCERWACLVPCQLLPVTRKPGDSGTDFTNQSHLSTWMDGQ